MKTDVTISIKFDNTQQNDHDYTNSYNISVHIIKDAMVYFGDYMFFVNSSSINIVDNSQHIYITQYINEEYRNDHYLIQYLKSIGFKKEEYV